MIHENPAQIAAAVNDLHPADIAELLDDLPLEDRLTLFEALPPEQGAAVLSELKGETLRLVLHRASPEKLGPQLDKVPGDEVTFLLEHLKKIDPEVETVQSLYVLDADGRRVGAVSLRKLFPASAET